MVIKKPFVVACIPAYNEERSIAKVVLQAKRYVDKVVVCSDGSTDVTAEIAEQLGAEVIRHERNMGYGAALCSLFMKVRELGADAMVLLDGDGQHDPSEIPMVVEPILKGEADVVSGSRFLERNNSSMPKYRMNGIKAITRLAGSVSYNGLTDGQCGFRAFNRKAVSLITPTEEGMGVSTEILIKAKENGLRLKEVPVNVCYDVEKPSTKNPLHHGLDVVLSTVKHYSIQRPLLFYGVPGAVALLAAITFWIWTLQSFAATRQIITNVALIAIGATIVGLMLLTTAIILWVLVSVIKAKS